MEYSSPILKLILSILITAVSLCVPIHSKPSIPSSSSRSVSNSVYNGFVSYGSEDQAGAPLYTLRNTHRIKLKRIKQPRLAGNSAAAAAASAGSESVKNNYSPMLSELEGDNSRSKMKLIRRSRGNNASIKSRANRSGNKSSEKFRASPLFNVVRVRYMDGEYGGERPSESTWTFHHTGQTQYNAEASLSSSASSSSSTYGNEEIKYDISNASAHPSLSSTSTRNEGYGYTMHNVGDGGGGGKSNTFYQKHGFNSQEPMRDFLHPQYQPGSLLSPSSSSELSQQQQQQQQHQFGEGLKEQYASVPSGSLSSGNLKETGGVSLKKKETGEKVGRKKEQIKGNSEEYAFTRSNDLRDYSGNNDDEHNNHNRAVKETRSSSNSHGTSSRPATSTSTTHYGLESELSPPPYEGEEFHGFYGVHPGRSVLMGGHHNLHHEMNTHPVYSPQVYGNHGKDESHASLDHPHREETNEDRFNEDAKGEHGSHASDSLLLAKTLIGTKALKVGTVFVVAILVLGIILMALLAKTGVILTPLFLPLAFLPVAIIALALFIPLIFLFVPIVVSGLAGGRRRKKRAVFGGSKKNVFIDDDDGHFHYPREMIYFHPPAVKEVNHADDHVETSLMSSLFASLSQTGFDFDRLMRLFESEKKLIRQTGKM